MTLEKGASQRKIVRKPRKPAIRPESGRVRAQPLKQEVLPPGTYLSIAEAAREFGMDHRTLTKRIADLGIRPAAQTPQGHMLYRLKELLDIERRNADGSIDPEKLDPIDRHAHYKAENEKLRVAKLRGELIARDDYEREAARQWKIASLGLDTVVDRVERDVGAAPAVLEHIERVIDEVREQMYAAAIRPPDSGEATLDVSESDSDGESAARE